MFNRRFVPYLVVVDVIVLLSVCYMGYQAYQNHVEFERFISDAQTFNSSVDNHHEHSSKDHAHHGEGLPVASRSDPIGQMKPPTSEHTHFSRQNMQMQDHSELYAYEVNGIPLFSNEPLSQEDLVVEGWQMDGQMTPAVKEAFKKIKSSSEDVIQRVVTPDGELAIRKTLGFTTFRGGKSYFYQGDFHEPENKTVYWGCGVNCLCSLRAVLAYWYESSDRGDCGVSVGWAAHCRGHAKKKGAKL